MIRKLRADDAEPWRALRLEALRLCPTAFSSDFEEASRNDISVFRSHIPAADARSALFGAFVDERLCGSAGVYAPPHPKLRHKGEVWGVYVSQEMRGRGLGRQLMEALIDHGRIHFSVMQLAVGVDNAPAHQLYRRLGFSSYGIEHRALRVSGVDYDNELMAMHFE